ncbi:MAG TPA: tRNA lysidine(34) synthetase TilS, partial [Candidatus Cloacimonas sp.]|nr:tRNA lysidine(34) synthetase TilS [Candidatus Cloacimonas sp.]
HQLRAEASEQDEAQIKQICMQLNVPLIIRRIELEGERDLENRARKARFEVFYRILESYRFDKILLAHHKSDLAETVLLNMFRGSGLSGMAGIKPLRGVIAHPMLIFSPEELKAILRDKDIPWREDASNSDPRFTRNRIRNELMPHLAEVYNPQIRDKLADSAAILWQSEQYILDKAMRRFKKICLESSGNRIILSIPDLLKAAPIERFYLLRNAYRLLHGTTQDFFQSNLSEIESILCAQGSKYISLPHGIYAVKRYQELLFSNVSEDIRVAEVEDLIIESERSRVVHMDHRFSFKYLKVLPAEIEEMDGYKVILDADKIVGKIRIRSRRDGDRFIPFGMNGFKKLKDFFIDEKVAKYDRDTIPIFADEEKILWVCPFRLDNRVRYDESSSRFLSIEAESLIKKSNRAASRKKRGTNEFDEL